MLVLVRLKGVLLLFPDLVRIRSRSSSKDAFSAFHPVRNMEASRSNDRPEQSHLYLAQLGLKRFVLSFLDLVFQLIVVGLGLVSYMILMEGKGGLQVGRDSR